MGVSCEKGLCLCASDRIIVALDCGEDKAYELAGLLQGHARWLKVGMTLFYSCGPAVVRRFEEMGFKVFLDLKLHDIPHQVGCAAASLRELGADMVTVHASGGEEMMRSAVDAFSQGSGPTSVLAVTVLTSSDASMLSSIGVGRSIAEQVNSLAMLAKDSGCSGVVCAPNEAEALRKALGQDMLIVCPGVRPQGADLGDQKRVATPAAAISAGASHIVVGRPITLSADPLEAFLTIARECDEALS